MGQKKFGRTSPRSWVLRLLERIALAVEHPINLAVKNPQLNPFYHTGPISIFLLCVVGLTGFFVFLFFQYGFEKSYFSVVTRIEGAFIARIVRAIHRYASGALVVTTLLHACRILFMERFRGPRWLAWCTGIAMTFILWVAGVTGYWLVWDQRSQLINAHFIDFLQRITPWSAKYVLWLLSAEQNGQSWVVVWAVFVIHVVLFLIVAGMTWLHLRHLNRPNWLPPVAWMGGALLILFLIAAIFPAGNLPSADFDRLPQLVALDPIYLYYLPLTQIGWATPLRVMFWIATLMAMVLPWWQRRQKQLVAVQIIEDRCTGCTKCAQDCPYHAIEMIKREDEKAKHPYLAVLTPSRCVGCGICIGACDDFYAIAWGDGTMPQALSQEIELAMARGRQRMGDRPIKLILTCERHAEQGAKQYLAHAPQGVELIVLPCVGAIQPSLLPYGLSLGASEVEVVGCPTFDCANREGNIWQEQRLIHERVPRLRAKYDDQPITAAWLSPDQFSQALPATLLPIVDADGETSQLDYLSTRVMNAWFSWRNWVAGIALLAAVLLLQIALTGLPFRPYASDTALVQVAFEAPAFYLMQHKVFAYAGRNHYSFHWEVDGESIYVYSYHRADSLLNSAEPIFASHYLPSGQHHLRLFLWDADAKWQGVFYEETIMLKEGQILRLNDVKAREKVRLIYAGWQ